MKISLKRVIGAVLFGTSVALGFLEITKEYNFIFGITAAIGLGLVFNWISFRCNNK